VLDGHINKVNEFKAETVFYDTTSVSTMLSSQDVFFVLCTRRIW